MEIDAHRDLIFNVLQLLFVDRKYNLFCFGRESLSLYYNIKVEMTPIKTEQLNKILL